MIEMQQDVLLMKEHIMSGEDRLQMRLNADVAKLVLLSLIKKGEVDSQTVKKYIAEWMETLSSNGTIEFNARVLGLSVLETHRAMAKSVEGFDEALGIVSIPTVEEAKNG